MKKILSVLAIAMMTAAAAMAQPGYGRPGGGPYGGGPRGGGYGMDRDRNGYFGTDWYGGIKFGLVGSHVSSESSELNGNRVKSGISLGLAAGFNISPEAAFESGLYYVEKGGSSKNSAGRFTYDLNYMEIPLLLKYYIYSDNRAVFQPFIGAYLGFGVSGEIKDYGAREAFNSYGSGYFRRGDSGLTFGCGVSWSFLYASMGYELGLANIGRDYFYDTRNRALIFSVGFAF